MSWKHCCFLGFYVYQCNNRVYPFISDSMDDFTAITYMPR